MTEKISESVLSAAQHPYWRMLRDDTCYTITIGRAEHDGLLGWHATIRAKRGQEGPTKTLLDITETAMPLELIGDTILGDR